MKLASTNMKFQLMQSDSNFLYFDSFCLGFWKHASKQAQNLLSFWIRFGHFAADFFYFQQEVLRLILCKHQSIQCIQPDYNILNIS